MANYVDSLFSCFWNELFSFIKLVKNSVILVISDIFQFKIGYPISKNATLLFCLSLI